MLDKELFFTNINNTQIAVYHWPAKAIPKAVILILHGMAEHSQRYDGFADALTANGLEVYSCDHRGHGQTGLISDRLGFFAEQNGWAVVLNDIEQIISRLKHQHPNLPLFLFGHSMGSYLARTCMVKSQHKFNGIVLSGTSIENLLLIRLSTALTSIMITFCGIYKKATLLDYLTFGSFNRAFRPNRTGFDWLSRDKSEVDLYCKDPLCGFQCTLGFFRDLFNGIRLINSDALYKGLKNKPPVLILSGTSDPVGHKGKDAPLLAASYSSFGFQDISYKLYDKARHELLHEINRNEVTRDIMLWLNARLNNS